MDTVVTAVTVGVGMLAIGTSLALAVALLGRRHRPAALPLLGVALALATGSLLHLLVTDPVAIGTVFDAVAWTDDDWWVVQGAVTTVVAGGVWTVFAVVYTGRGGLIATGALAGATFLSAAAVVVAALAAAEGIAPGHVRVLSVLLLATAIFLAVGIGLLLLASVRQNAFPIAEPLLLSAGAAALCSGVLVAQQLGAPWLVLAANAIASATLLVPVRRYPMFDTLPAARVAGRSRVFEALSTGVIVVDRDGRVRDVNERAAHLSDVTPEAATDERFAELIDNAPDPAALAGAATPVRITTDDHRTLELTGRSIEGPGARPVGYVVLCSDVTARRVRAERFALLRRFVVDVVGDRMADVAATASAATEDDDPTRRAAAERIWTETTALTRLVASARDVERAIDSVDSEVTADGEAPPDDDATDDEALAPTSLSRAVTAAADAAAEGADADVAVASLDGTVETGVPRPVLRAIVRAVLEDVCRQAASVEIAVRGADGPAIEIGWSVPPEAEAGDDTADALHSLPVTRLAIDLAGGTLSRSVTGDGRERITISLPRAGSAAAVLATSGSRQSGEGSASVGLSEMGTGRREGDER